MTRAVRQALANIRGCVASDRYLLLRHFIARMDQRGIFWPDVVVVLEDPDEVRDGGRDRFERPKWIVAGKAADGLPIELVCALDVDEKGDSVVFITVY